MTPEQLEQLSTHLYQSIAGNVKRRLEWWQNQRKVVEGKVATRSLMVRESGHSRDPYVPTLLARWEGLLSVRRVSRTGTRSMTGLLATSGTDTKGPSGPFWFSIQVARRGL